MVAAVIMKVLRFIISLLFVRAGGEVLGLVPEVFHGGHAGHHLLVLWGQLLTHESHSLEGQIDDTHNTLYWVPEAQHRSGSACNQVVQVEVSVQADQRYLDRQVRQSVIGPSISVE